MASIAPRLVAWSGDGEHRRYVQRGTRRAIEHPKVGGTEEHYPLDKASNSCVRYDSQENFLYRGILKNAHPLV
jgi:hypothetical protein